MKTFRIGQSAMFEMDAHWRIESVGRALDYLEQFLPHAKEQAFLRMKSELESCENNREREEIEAELELMEIEWTGRFPAYFYGSLLVLLWGEIEAVMERFATEIQSTKSINLAFGDIIGRSTYNRLKKYTQAVLGVPLPENSVIEDLQFLRNLYAHHGGDTSSQTKNKLNRIRAVISSNAGGVSLSDGFVLVNATFLRKAAETATVLITKLRAVHPSTEPGLVEVDESER